MIEFEVRRKLFHLLLGLLLVYLIYIDLIGVKSLLLLVCIGLALSMLSLKYNVPIISWFLDTFERDEYRKQFPGKGVFFFILGSLLVLVLFEKNIALASILVLSIGDSSSHLVGKYFGKVKHPLSDKKFIEGHIIGAILGGLFAILFLPWHIALISSFIAMFVEGIDFIIRGNIFDDNLIVPMVFAFTSYLLLLI